MTTDALPSGIGDLFGLATRVKEGLVRHGPWLFHGQFTAEQMEELLADAQTTEQEFAAARAEKAAAGRRLAAADEALTSWLAKARLVVMLAFGSQWSESWIAAGVHPSRDERAEADRTAHRAGTAAGEFPGGTWRI